MSARSETTPAGPARQSGGSAFWPLFKVTLNNTFGLSAARHIYLVQKRRLWEPIAIAFAVVTAGGFLEFLLYVIARGFVGAGLQIGQPEIVFTFAFLVASVLVLFFGLMAVISIFYFSTDLETLVPLPLRPGTIVLAKFGAVAVGEYIGILLAMAPAAIAYAQAVDTGLAYWLAVALVILLAPVVPLAIASVLSMVVMRFINRRHRDILIVVFGSLFAFAVLAFQMGVMNTVPQNATAEYLQRILSGQISLVSLVGRAFPPAIWATRTIVAGSAGLRLVSLLAYVGVSAAAIWVMSLVGGRFFYGGLIGGSELARRRLTARQAAVARAVTEARTVQASPISALFWREWRLFMRVPLYVFNGFAASLIVPVIMIFGFRGIRTDPEIARMIAAINASGNAPFFLALGVAALTVFVVSMNTTSASAISREGPKLWISKVIPVTPEQQVQGKLLFSMAAALVSAVPILAVFGFALNMSLFHLAGAAVLSLLGSVIAMCVGLLVDTARPYLRWTNPQQAVKSNLNVILPLPVVIGLIAGLWFLSSWLYKSLGFGELTVMSILSVVLAALAVLAYRATISSARRFYERLDA